MKKYRFFLSGAIILTVMMLNSGCNLFPKEEEVLAPPLMEPPEISYETKEVKKGTIEKSINAVPLYL